MTTFTRWALPAALLTPEEDRGLGDQPDSSSRPDETAPGESRPDQDNDAHETDRVIADLASTPAALARLIDNRPDDDLMQPAQDGGWGLVELIPHVRDWERIHANRLDLALAENPATLQEHDDSLWAIEHGYRDQDTREALREFAELRQTLVTRLERLSQQDWQRTVILPKRGPSTFLQLMRMLIEHDAKHVLQAKDVLA